MNRILAVVLSFACLLVGVCSVAQQQTVPPLHTRGYQVLDRNNQHVRLASVNWYGFDQKEYVVGGLDHAPLEAIVGQIKAIGLNSVRLPWANETLERSPVVPGYALKANPELRGKRAMEIMDVVIDALARAHIMVILDNHMSRADWCCSNLDDNGLWYNTEYPESRWLDDWRTIVRRYDHQPWVVGADLRNELRSTSQWGGGDPKLDWHAAAERGGNAVLGANPNLLVIVEGTEYSTDLTDFAKLPVVLKVAHRLVYSPHAYPPQEHTFDNYAALRKAYDGQAGYLLHSKPAVPLWVGEFGTCQTLDCEEQGQWLRWFVQYLDEKDLSWSWWPLNGTQSSGESREYDAVETYGLLTTDYQHIAAPKVVDLLRTIMAPKK